MSTVKIKIGIVLELALAVALAFSGVGLFIGILQSFPFFDSPFSNMIMAFIAGAFFIACTIFLTVDAAAKMKKLYS